MKKVLLIVPAKKTLYGEPRYPVYGIAMIASVLRIAGFDPQILDLRFSSHKGVSVVDQVRNLNPDIIGFTVTNWDFNEALGHAENIKAAFPSLPIVFGGPQVSLCIEESIRQNPVDYVVFGEGEETAVELFSAITEHKEDLSGIKGIAWKKEGRFIVNEARPLIKDLDALPYPAYDLMPMSNYRASDEFRISVITSRGCPFGCIFCTSFATMGRRVRLRDPIKVIDEMEHWHRTLGANHFTINDDNILINRERALIFFKELIRRNLPITYSLDGGIRADCADPELFEYMKKTHCSLVAIGIESADEVVLKNIRKGETLEEIRKAIINAKKAGLFVKGYFIIGLPGDTPEKVRKSFQFALDTGIDMPRFALVQAFPHTELAKWVKENASFLQDPYDYVLTQTDGMHSSVHYELPDFNKEKMWKVYKWAIKNAEKVSFKNMLIRRFGKAMGNLLSLLTNYAPIRKAIVFAYTHKLISIPK